MTGDDHESVRGASAPCMSGDSIDNTLDAGNEAAVKVLQSLLEAERAGSRIARETLSELQSAGAPASLQDLVALVGRDEVRYCSMLLEQVRRLGVEPVTTTGDFYGKCMAIADIRERLAFLNRGQGWVVRKIDEILPGLLDIQLIDALQEMRSTHETNIQATTREIE